ncbi:MAG: 50S ribosomal protein L13 [bacterium]
MKSQLAKVPEKRIWHIMDASTMPLGRLSTQIAKFLMGKYQVDYTPNVDSGDFVIVTNAKLVVLTGAKLTDKKYYSHSGIPGGFRERRAEEVLSKSPRKIIEHSVRGMLPKNKLQDVRLRRLKVYDGVEHPHAAQITN